MRFDRCVAVMRQVRRFDPPQPLHCALLEQRVLMSASPAAVADGVSGVESAPLETAAGPSSVESATSTSLDLATPNRSGSQAGQTFELVLVDTAAEGYQQLLDDIQFSEDETRRFDVFLFDTERDGIEQITTLLHNYSALDALHIVSHGSEGNVHLGSSSLNINNLGAYAGQLAKWGNAFSSDADLLIYGCDLAGDAAGEELAESLSALTGADVTASDDLTGHASLGGDWDLEFGVGVIDTPIAFSTAIQQDWMSVLTEGPTVTAITDTAILSDSNTGAISFTIGDPDTSVDSLVVSAASSDQAIVPDTNIALGGSGANRTVTVTPLAGQFGSVTITLGVSDGTATTQESFGLTVIPRVITVNTAVDELDGTVTDIASLIANPGGSGISLREALAASNNTTIGATPDEILFDIAGAGPHTILLNGSLGALPDVTDSVFIDGWSEPDHSTAPVIEIDGRLLNASADGLTVTSGDSTIRGLSVINFRRAGIVLSGGSGNTLHGNYIGIDSNGDSNGNRLFGLQVVNSANNQIGGIGVTERNVIGANGGIAGDGINVLGVGSSGNTIVGNYIGTDPTGMVGRANSTNGIYISGGATSTTIGGPTEAHGNVISGNLDDGVEISGSTTSGHRIENNLIGVAADGVTPLGNGQHGVFIEDAPSNIIGSAGQGNVIGSNSLAGVLVAGVNGAGNKIQGNVIGTDRSLIQDLGNSSGVLFYNKNDSFFSSTIGDPSSNLVGGILAGEANVITNNAGSGVAPFFGVGNSIRGNAIYVNGSLGIDLGSDHVTVNDSGDGDAGPNQRQNFPLLSTVSINGAGLLISGSLNSVADTVFDVDVYSSQTSDASGNGEAERYLGSYQVTTDAIGNASLEQTLSGVAVVSGEFITATATDPNGNTSEFAFNRAVVGNTAPVLTSTGGQIITPSTDEDTTSAAFLVSDIFGSTITDADTSSLAGIAVTSITANGTWEYSLNGTTWFDVSPPADTISATNALLLRAADFLRYVPDNANGELVSITYRAWDQTSGKSGTRVDPGSGGGVTAFSTVAEFDSASLTVTHVNDGASGEVRISGTPNENQVLTASNTLSDADGIGTITYQWQRDGINITNATAVTYTLTSADVGTMIRVVASYIDDQGTVENVRSAAVGPVVNVNHSPTGAVVVSGWPAEDQTLTVSNTIADADGLGAITYQWQRDGVDVIGATGTSYSLGDADVGALIRVVASYTDDLGTSESVESLAVGPVANVNDAPTVSSIANAVILADGTTGPISFTVGDAETDPGSLIVSATSSNQELVTDANVSLSGSGASRAITITPVAEQFGILTIAIDVFDGEATVQETFELLVVPRVVTVTTTVDELDGDTSDILALINNPGGGGVSLREAIAATNNTLVGTTPDQIHFDIDDSDSGHVYYKEDFAAGLPATVTATTVSDTAVTDFDSDYAYAQHSWFRIELNDSLPGLQVTDELVIDGYTQSGATKNTLTLGQNATLKVELTTRSVAQYDGIRVAATGAGSEISGLVINSFGHAGIFADSGADNIRVHGNFIGTDITGTVDLGVSDAGVHLRSSGNQIGGPNVEQRNVISGNDSRGIATFTFGEIESGNVIQNNYVGVDATGIQSLGNSGNSGIQLFNNDGARILDNVIAGNTGHGIRLFASNGVTNTVIQGNLIGVGADGAIVVGNDRDGVHIDAAVVNTTIGGLESGQANTIANNSGDGIEIKAGSETAIRGNRIFANGKLAIDLEGAIGVNANDALDVDAGPNGLQNYPQLFTAESDGTNTIITGQLDTSTNSTFVIDFFSSLTADATGHGEAERYLGSATNLFTDASGNVRFTEVFAGVSLADGEHVTATATDQFGNTSEFSLNVIAVRSNNQPTGSVVVYGLAVEDQTLTVSNSLADADGLGVITYQWQRNGINVIGATGTTYRLEDADVGFNISAVASYTDVHGASATVSSNVVGPVVHVNDAPTGVVTITGQPTEGHTLTVANSLADPDGLGVITYQWQRNGTNVIGATGTTYRLTNTDAMADITAVASYIDGNGSSESVTSLAVGPIENVNDAPSITSIGDQVINEDSSTSEIAFHVADIDNAVSNVAAFSSNSALIANSQISLTNLGGGRWTLQATPETDQFGTATITISVSDGELAAVTSFQFDVVAVNDAPLLAVVEDQVVAEFEESGVEIVRLSAVDVDGDTLTFSMTAGTQDSSFTIDSDGVIRLGQIPRFSQVPVHVLNISVTDDGAPGLSDTVLVRIDVDEFIGNPNTAAQAEPTGSESTEESQESLPTLPATAAADDESDSEQLPVVPAPVRSQAVSEQFPEVVSRKEPVPLDTVVAFVISRGAEANLVDVPEATRLRPVPTNTGRLDDESMLLDFTAATAAYDQPQLRRDMDEIREDLEELTVVQYTAAAASVAGGTSLTVGYVLWAIRGGWLATSVLAQMPAWRLIDPLVVLSNLNGSEFTAVADDMPEDDSLESILEQSARAEQASATGEDIA